MMAKQNTIKRASAGFSLIEMMIALTVGLMIIGALTAVLISSGSASRTNERGSELQANGRYALDILKRDVQSAGYYGLTGRTIDQSPVNLPNDCFAGFANNIRQRVWGANDGVNPFAAKCIPAAQYAGSDILVVRYASIDSAPSLDNTATANYNTAGGLYLRSAYGMSKLYQIPNYPDFTGATPQRDHRLEAHVYYINRDSVAGSGDGVPSLRRLVLDATGSMVDELVISGIQNLQVQYGVTTGDPKAPITQYFDALNVNAGVAPATDAITSPITVDSGGKISIVNNWGAVNAVRLWMLVRNPTPERNFVNGTAYPMGDKVIAAANDGYRRQVFTTTLQLRN